MSHLTKMLAFLITVMIINVAFADISLDGSMQDSAFEVKNDIESPEPLGAFLSNLLESYDSDEAREATQKAFSRTSPRTSSQNEMNRYLTNITDEIEDLRDVYLECQKSYCVSVISAETSQASWVEKLAGDMPNFGNENYAYAYHNSNGAILIFISY